MVGYCGSGHLKAPQYLGHAVTLDPCSVWDLEPREGAMKKESGMRQI